MLCILDVVSVKLGGVLVQKRCFRKVRWRLWSSLVAAAAAAVAAAAAEAFSTTTIVSSDSEGTLGSFAALELVRGSSSSSRSFFNNFF